MRARLYVLLVASVTAFAPARADPAVATSPDSAAARSDATSSDDALAATSAKFNTYVAYMNRSLRAVDSLARYRSWVDMRTGPTGRERIVYGLYAPYDLTSERAAVMTTLAAPPALPELDNAMRAFVAANDALSPVLVKADGYYSRADYKLDGMAEGKVLHKDIVTDGDAFLTARDRLDAVMRTQKLAFDKIRLATIEAREGRKVPWHIADVMMTGRVALDALTANPGVRVDLQAFDGAMAAFGSAVKDLDDYAAAHTGAFGAFGSFPDELLSHLREVQGRLKGTKGDLCRAAGLDMTFIESNWNTMVTTSELPIALQDR